MKRKFVCDKCGHYLGEFDLLWFNVAVKSPLANSDMFCRLCGSTDFYIDDNANVRKEGKHDFTIDDEVLVLGSDGLSHIDKNEEE